MYMYVSGKVTVYDFDSMLFFVPNEKPTRKHNRNDNDYNKTKQKQTNRKKEKL